MGVEIMTFIESICFAKVYAAAMGLAPANSVTKYEKEVVSEALKQMANQKTIWTQAQKDMYKLLVDIAKENN